MPQPQKKKEPSFLDTFFGSIFDRIGLNGVEGVRRSQEQSKPEQKPVSDDQLRRQGWSEADIRWLRQQERNQKPRR